MKSQNGKCVRSALLALVLTLSLAPVPMLAQDAKDLDEHWAAEAIEACQSYGIMQGDNGYFRPNDEITRAELAAMVNRAFGYDALSVPPLTGYTDVPPGKWYVDDMAAAIALGILSGYGNGIAAPEDKVTREQAAVVLAKVLRLTADTSRSTGFTDMNDVSAWATDAVLTMEQSGYIAGDHNRFMPKKNITRGETAQLLRNVFGVIVDDVLDAHAATFENVTIRKPGVVLKNAVITGDLLITEGVGDGEVWLESVQISGRLLAAGGGENSIHVVDLSVGDSVVVDKPAVAGDEPVCFHAVQTNDTLVVLQGTVREIIIAGDLFIIIDNNGEKSIFNLLKPEGGENAPPTVMISENASVGKITALVPATVTGGGAVGQLEAHTDGVTIDEGVQIDPASIEAAEGVSVKVGGEAITPDPTPAPSTAPTASPPKRGSTSSGNTGGGTTNAATPAIGTQPQSASVAVGVTGTTHTLTVLASVTSGTLSYQWYSNTSTSTTGGTEITGETNASYAAPIDTVGPFYYYVVVTNTNNSVNGTKTASVTSNAVTLTVAVPIPHSVSLVGNEIASASGSTITLVSTITGSLGVVGGETYLVANTGLATALGANRNAGFQYYFTTSMYLTNIEVIGSGVTIAGDWTNTASASAKAPIELYNASATLTIASGANVGDITVTSASSQAIVVADTIAQTVMGNMNLGGAPGHALDLSAISSSANAANLTIGTVSATGSADVFLPNAQTGATFAVFTKLGGAANSHVIFKLGANGSAVYAAPTAAIQGAATSSFSNGVFTDKRTTFFFTNSTGFQSSEVGTPTLSFTFGTENNGEYPLISITARDTAMIYGNYGSIDVIFDDNRATTTLTIQGTVGTVTFAATNQAGAKVTLLGRAAVASIGDGTTVGQTVQTSFSTTIANCTNFYVGADAANAAVVNGAPPIGTYTWTSGLTSSSVSGWFKATP